MNEKSKSTEEKIKIFLHCSKHKIYVKEGKLYDNETELKESENKSENNGNESRAKKESRKIYTDFLKTHFENLVILTGAGSSIIKIGDDKEIGLDRKGLWNECKKSIGEKQMNNLSNKINPDPTKINNQDIEALLSQAYKAKDVIKQGKCDKKCKECTNIEDIDSCIEKIENTIKNCCTIKLIDKAPHKDFLKKITSRKIGLPRVKIFTLNYDTLFEQAAENFPIIDGFSYSSPRVFNGKYYDYDFVIRENSRIENEENYVSNVFHLYKLHGSLDWCEEGKNNKIIKKSDTENPSMIFPNYEKYQSSYKQPYFEMMSRFQQALRKENVLLVTIGFSFRDSHIKTIIKEAIDNNHSFQLVIVNKDINVDDKLFEDEIASGKTIYKIAETFEDFTKNYPVSEIYETDGYMGKSNDNK